MRVAILSFYDFDHVQGGMEVFTEHLRQAFPNSELITYFSATQGMGRINMERLNLQEAKMGLAIGNKFHKMNRSNPFDLLISNGIVGWYVSILKPEIPMINVHHYTLRGLADNVLVGTPGYAPSKYIVSLLERTSSTGKENIAVSCKTQRELRRYYNLDSRVIENGIPLDHFKPIQKERAREMLEIGWDGELGIFVGRADYTKGFDIVQQVAQSQPGLRILCITPSQAKGENLIIRNNVPNKLMPICYSAADFFIFPSRYENASISCLEAMACNLPMVVSRTGIFEDIDESIVGRIVSSSSPEDYRSAIQEVLRSKTGHTRELVEKRYSLERFIDDYRNLAKEMTGRF